MSSDQVQDRQDETARKKGRGCLLNLSLAAFLIVAIPALAYLYFTTRSARLVEDELAKIRAAGEPATAEELDKYYEYPPADKDATRLWLAAIKSLSGPEYWEGARGLPVVDESVEAVLIPPPGREWEYLEAVEEFLAKNSDGLDLLYEAAEMGGAARYRVDFSGGPHISPDHIYWNCAMWLKFSCCRPTFVPVGETRTARPSPSAPSSCWDDRWRKSRCRAPNSQRLHCRRGPVTCCSICCRMWTFRTGI